LPAHFGATLQINTLYSIIPAYALTSHGQEEVRRQERQNQTRDAVIDAPELDFVLEMRQQGEAVNLTNKANEEAQRDEQEMEDNETVKRG
jgi:hypothetical protein